MRIIAVLSLMVLLAMTACAEEPGDLLENIAENIGNFKLSPVPKGAYWYDTDTHTYQYNEYTIDIICEPVQAKVEINGQYAGVAPGTCSFTGSHGEKDFITIKVMPVDPGFKPAKKILKGSSPLPKTMEFTLSR